jgi:hypothetical protein
VDKVDNCGSDIYKTLTSLGLVHSDFGQDPNFSGLYTHMMCVPPLFTPYVRVCNEVIIIIIISIFSLIS